MKSIRLLALLILSITFSNAGSAAVTKAEFDYIIKKVYTTYRPITKALRGDLVIMGAWDSTIQNAVAQQERNSNRWEIFVFGGLARVPNINVDGLALVICHELGHHIAGYPKFLERDHSWSSAEGQADYFATLKCARKLFANDDNEAIVKNMKVPAIVANNCKKSFANEREIYICIRSSMAAKNMTTALESARGNAVVDDSFTSFETPAPALNRVAISYKHPGTQCRLDTLFQGSLCDKNVDEKLSMTEDTAAVCSKSNGDVLGLRPACWYNVD